LNSYLFEKTPASEHCVQCYANHESLLKIILFDTQLAFEAYVNIKTSEILEAKREAEKYAKSLETRVSVLTKQLHELSLHDDLTGLLNRRAFYDNLSRELLVSERLTNSISMIYFDLNDFKKLNASQGYIAGDALLKVVAASLNETLRSTDFGFRYGGDGFCILLPNTDILEAKILSKRLMANFIKKDVNGITFSIGIVQSSPDMHLNTDDMVELADERMYKAKKLSRFNHMHNICGG
jgi:diguanylate cyclase